MEATFDLDDELFAAVTDVAARQGITAAQFIDAALRDALALARSEGMPFVLPTFDGGGFPEGFPFDSGTKMIEFLEGPNAKP